MIEKYVIDKKERNEDIKRLFKRKWSYSEIGRKHGISRQRVFQIAHGIVYTSILSQRQLLLRTLRKIIRKRLGINKKARFDKRKFKFRKYSIVDEDDTHQYVVQKGGKIVARKKIL